MSTPVPVQGFAESLTNKAPLSGATISVYGCTSGRLDATPSQVLTADSQGRFALVWPEGADLTLLCEHPDYHPVQSLTFQVPPGGMMGKHQEIAFQVPTRGAYDMLLLVLPTRLDRSACQLVITVAAAGMTLADDPQGEAGAVAVLDPPVGAPFYAGMFKWGPLKDKTDPLQRDLTETSADGGVFFFNLPPQDAPYTVTAQKDGVTFTTCRFYAVAGRLVNGAPPNGPTVISPPPVG